MADEKTTRTKKIIKGVIDFLRGERVIIIEKEEIKSILPHRGRMLLLDKVIVTAKKITGEFTITPEACEGHKIGDQLMFRGVDYAEMTAQLLGVWLAQEAAQYPNFNGKLAPLRKTSFKCITPAVPGDLLKIEMPVKEGSEEEEEGNPRIETIGREGRPERIRQQVIAVNSEAWVGDRKTAVIYFIELGIVDAKSKGV